MKLFLQKIITATLPHVWWFYFSVSCNSVHICDSDVSIVLPEWYDYQLEFSGVFAAFIGVGRVDMPYGC